MRIAIFGATSEIAQDLILSFAAHNDHQLVLLARRTEAVVQWLSEINLPNKYPVIHYDLFKSITGLDAILNFVGGGDPAKINDYGSAIFEATLDFDELAISYLKSNPNCRYVFMSSGAAYGSDFNLPVDEKSLGVFPINSIEPKDWYGIAKMYCECRHRMHSNFHIVDVRIFSYFSKSQNINSKFLICEILRAMMSKEIFKTSAENIVRDYLAPTDLYQLIKKILLSPPINMAVDCYSRAPIDKLSLLDYLSKNFGLQYEVSKIEIGMQPTGNKLNYYSLNRRAAHFGYEPEYNSLESLLLQVKNFIRG